MAPKPIPEDGRTKRARPDRSKKRDSLARIDGLFSDLETIPPMLPGAVPIAPPAEPARPQTGGLHADPASPAAAPVLPDFSSLQTLPQELSPLAWQSLREGRPIAQTDRSGANGDSNSAVLAFGKPLPGRSEEFGQAALLLELIDDNPGRIWSEDEQLLVEQVSDQLSLALENARLFQEARRRNEELTVLNRIVGAVSTMKDLDTALNEVLTRVLESIGFRCGLISMNDPASNTLQLAVYRNLPEMMIKALRTHGLQGTLCALVYESGQTLYLPQLDQFSAEALERFGGPHSLESAVFGPLQAGFRSYLGVPLLSKGTCFGTICVLHPEEIEISASRIRLQEAIAQQVGVMIENVRLFEQTERTRDALQVSERYQKGVARAVAALTERGITALGEVLETLGQAAQVDRVHYLETQVDQIGPYWRALSEWRESGTASRMGSPALRRIGLDDDSGWLMQLISRGYVVLDPTHEYSEELQTAFGADSSVLLSVPGRHELPGCLVLEQLDRTREWAEDEIAALQTAASALSNTIAREDLFTQVQANLAETEAQYQASSRLNSATSYADILNVLRRHTILGHVSSIEVSLNLFDRPWTRAERPEWLAPIAVWSSADRESRPENGSRERISLREWNTADLLLDAERPTIVLDAAGDPRLDDTIRRLYVSPHGARSLLFAPLNVSGRWIGHMVAVYRQTTAFPESDLRRLTSLAGQATVALEGLRLVEELQRRARQLQTAAEIARDTSSTLTLDSLLSRSVNLLSERFGYPGVSIYLLDDSGENAVVAGATGGSSEDVNHLSSSLPVNSASVVGKVIAEGTTLVVNDPNQPRFRDLFSNGRGIGSGGTSAARSELGIPLKIGAQVIGALDVQSHLSNAFSDDDVAVLQTLADQIAVAVENARAYELTQKAVEEIREADRLKTQFLANMSHELRTPLNSIIGFSRVILKGIDGPVSDQQIQDLTAIYNSGQHLLGLINDVLDLSRIEAGKMDLSFESNVNLTEIIRSVLSTTVGLIKDKPIELEQRIDPDLPLIRIDPMKIRQVLINLLSNAAKFTDEGVIRVEAERKPMPDGRPGVIVRVIDSGPGIAPADQNRLFQPFSQVDGSLTRKTGGSGLGLSICQHLIRMHGGDIGLRSTVGTGSTFYFILPVSPVEAAADVPDTGPASTDGPQVETTGLLNAQPPVTGGEPSPSVTADAVEPASVPAAAEAAARPATVEAPEPSARLILSVDRDPNITDLYRRYLVDQALTVISLSNLDQVVTVARSIQPLVITLDVTMQGRIGAVGANEAPPPPGDPYYIDGWQVLQMLQSDPETRSIPVLVCSLAADADRARTLGAADVLMKPILPQDLVNAIQKHRQ